ncbi:MAG: transcriptional repressor LexA, partial [Clostridiales bacterium]|nr:transcriptional repressor LexA [Clostridiales bacterium]
KQQRIYDFIKNYIEKHNMPPTIREICDATGLTSTSTVHTHLKNLESKGYISRKKSKNRYMEIAEKGFYESKDERLPIIREIKYGTDITADENIEGYIPMSREYLRGEENFVLKISEDSMLEAGIRGNDMVIVKKQSFAEDGDIVAAVSDGVIVCRRFFKEDGKYALIAENKNYAPIRRDDILILGKVTGIFRIL